MIEFTLINPKLISINEQYIHPVRKTKRGTYTSYFAKSPYLKEVQQYFEEVLAEKVTEEDICKLKEEVNETNGVFLSLKLGLPRKDFYEYDLSNFVKSVEDCLVKRIKIDDSRNVKLDISKVLYNSANNDWRLDVKVSSIEIEKLEEFV